MSEAGKAEALRVMRMTLDEVEAELGRERRIVQEVMRANCAGRPRDGYPARRELRALRARRVPAP